MSVIIVEARTLGKTFESIVADYEPANKYLASSVRQKRIT
jgi:hypothetical protein